MRSRNRTSSTSVLLNLIKSSHPDWDAIRKRIGTDPSEAYTTSSPLLAMVAHEREIAPPDIIKSLLSPSTYNSTCNMQRKCKLSESEKLEILTVACYNYIMKGEIILILLEEFKFQPSMEFVYRLIKDVMSFEGNDAEEDGDNDNDNDDEQRDEGVDQDENDVVHVEANICSSQDKLLHECNDGSEKNVQFSNHVVQTKKRPNSKISALIQYWPNVLNVVDKNGNIILHHACGKGNISIHLVANIIATSLSYHTQQANQYNNKGSKCSQDEQRENTIQSKNNNHGGLLTCNRYMKTPLHNLCRLINEKNTERAIEKIILCCDMLSTQQDAPKLPILHSAITSVTKPRYFNLLLEALKQQQQQHRLCCDCYCVITNVTDQWNRTLLQVAIDNVMLNTNRHAKELLQILIHSSTVTPTIDQSDDNSKYVKEDGYKMLASYRDDKFNRLPMHYACESGLPLSDGLDDILDAYPSALEEADEVTSLFPFMLAACNPTTAQLLEIPYCTILPKTEQFCDLSAIYHLLRKNPIIIEMSRHQKNQAEL